MIRLKFFVVFLFLISAIDATSQVISKEVVDSVSQMRIGHFHRVAYYSDYLRDSLYNRTRVRLYGYNLSIPSRYQWKSLSIPTYYNLNTYKSPVSAILIMEFWSHKTMELYLKHIGGIGTYSYANLSERIKTLWKSECGVGNSLVDVFSGGSYVVLYCRGDSIDTNVDVTFKRRKIIISEFLSLDSIHCVAKQ